eukprot:1159136-Pelagomonas_calceolata.AAC.10
MLLMPIEPALFRASRKKENRNCGKRVQEMQQNQAACMLMISCSTSVILGLPAGYTSTLPTPALSWSTMPRAFQQTRAWWLLNLPSLCLAFLQANPPGARRQQRIRNKEKREFLHRQG